MKDKFRLSWKKIKRVSSPGNSERCKVLRHLYAREMLAIYDSNKHVVNIDESWMSVSDFRASSWNYTGSDNNYSDRVLGCKVNMIAAVSSKGYVWLSLTQCNTDDEVISCFLTELAKAFRIALGDGWK